MSDAALLEMVKEIRWKTLKILEAVDDDMARFTPPGLYNTILWHSGHALIVVEQLCFVAAGVAAPQVPIDWFDKFGWNSKPAMTTQWPKLTDIAERLKDQRQRLLALVEAYTPEQLDRIVGMAPRNRTVRGEIVHALHDEAQHQGEMYLLKKLWNLQTL